MIPRCNQEEILVAAGFSLRRHRLEGLCYQVIAKWYELLQALGFIPSLAAGRRGGGGKGVLAAVLFWILKATTAAL